MILKIKGLERGEMIREEIRETQHPSSRGAISVTRHRNQLTEMKTRARELQRNPPPRTRALGVLRTVMKKDKGFTTRVHH